MNILPYPGLLQSTYPTLSRTNLRRLSRIVKAMLAMTGRVTMLGISRWTGQGGSYRTVQRFFGEQIPWVQLFWQFFAAQLYQSEREYILGGDECVVTKSGKHTHGLDHFFSGLLSKVVPSIAIFALSLIDVKERRSYPAVKNTEDEKSQSVGETSESKR